MNQRLRESVSQAETTLPIEAQDRLAEIVEAFTANHGLTAETVCTPEELEHIRRIAAEPFEPADQAEVKAFFQRR